MTWTDQLHKREHLWGAPNLVDGDSRIGEAMGGLADDDYNPTTVGLTFELDELDRVHEAMGGMCRADDS